MALIRYIELKIYKLHTVHIEIYIFFNFKKCKRFFHVCKENDSNKNKYCF